MCVCLSFSYVGPSEQEQHARMKHLIKKAFFETHGHASVNEFKVAEKAFLQCPHFPFKQPKRRSQCFCHRVSR